VVQDIRPYLLPRQRRTHRPHLAESLIVLPPQERVFGHLVEVQNPDRVGDEARALCRVLLRPHSCVSVEQPKPVPDAVRGRQLLLLSQRQLRLATIIGHPIARWFALFLSQRAQVDVSPRKNFISLWAIQIMAQNEIAADVLTCDRGQKRISGRRVDGKLDTGGWKRECVMDHRGCRGYRQRRRRTRRGLRGGRHQCVAVPKTCRSRGPRRRSRSTSSRRWLLSWQPVVKNPQQTIDPCVGIGQRSLPTGLRGLRSGGTSPGGSRRGRRRRFPSATRRPRSSPLLTLFKSRRRLW